MKIITEIIIICILSNVLIKLYAKKKPINYLIFYPKQTQERALELGLCDEKALKDNKKRYLIFFTALMFIVLMAIIMFLNKVHDFKTAFLQALLFMEAGNCFDAFFNHVFWPSIDPLWKIKELEGLPNTLPLNELLRERIVIGIIQAVAAAGMAFIISLF